MSWPQAVEYNQAIQCPGVCFRDADLRRTTVRVNALGMPAPHSGNFADVYQMDEPGGASWAVKCFTRPVQGLQERYQAIAAHLRDAPRPYMVDFQYLDEGIRIRSDWFPAVKMRWVEGFTLNQFIATRLQDRTVLERLAELWLRLATQMHEDRIAHGDLQHGNVMLVPGSKANSLALKLVDYDGLCVPSLLKRPSGEYGHPHYQHPRRGEENRKNPPADSAYGFAMDRFSLLVIYTAVRALALDGPTLWKAFDRGENLLFREADFVTPAESPLFTRLWTDFGGDVRTLAGRLLLASLDPLDSVPAMADIVDDNKARPLSMEEQERISSVLGVLMPQRRPTPAPPKPVEPARPTVSSLPPPTPEQRSVAAGQFERANQVIATGGYEYGLRLLLSCCQLDRANLIYRQALRRTEKARYKNNLRGSWLAWLTTWPAKARIKAALRGGDHLHVLDVAELVLLRNPWDVGVQLDMAKAAEVLGLTDLAVWTLEQARQKEPNDPVVNRTLARVYEKRGNFSQAIALWALVRRACPQDIEAHSKVNDLAANDTIRRVQDEVAAADEIPIERKSERGNGTPEDALRRRIDSAPTDAKAYLALAQHYRKANDLAAAGDILQEGLGPTGNAFELIVELSEVEIEPFRRDLAVVETKLQSAPRDAKLDQHRSRLLKEINTRELEMLRRQVDRYPTDLAQRLALGIRLLNAGQVDEAIRELQSVRGDARFMGKAAYHLGNCFKSRNNHRLALRNFEEALQHLPQEETELRKETLYQLASSCAATGDLARAVDVGNELAHQDYAYRDIGRLLDEWNGRLEQTLKS